MGISKQYTKEIKDQLNYSATWLPGTIVSPGDIGTIINYEFIHQTNLTDLGIPFEAKVGSTI